MNCLKGWVLLFFCAVNCLERKKISMLAPTYINIRVIAENSDIPKWKIKKSVNILQRIYAKTNLNIVVTCSFIEYAPPQAPGPSEASDIHSDYSAHIEGIALFNGLKKIVSKMKETGVLPDKNDPIFFLHAEEDTRVHGASIKGGIFTNAAIAVLSVKKQDTPKEIGEAMAHELAHLLGSKHDGDGNTCPSTGYLMEPIYSASRGIKGLSKCTEIFIKNEIEKNEKKRSQVDT